MTFSKIIFTFAFAIFSFSFFVPNFAFAGPCEDSCTSTYVSALTACGAGNASCQSAANSTYTACIASCTAPAAPAPAAGGSGATATPPPTSYSNIMSQGIIFAGICTSRTTPCDCRDNGNCTIDNIMQVFVNVATFILGISGSIVLLMFIYGGVMWLTSAGNEARVSKGKDILAGSVIGLAIIFGAYVAISVIISALKTGDLPESDQTIEGISTQPGQSAP